MNVSEVAPDAEVRDLEGRYRVLSGWRGRRVALVFVQPDCPYSRAILPVLAGLPVEPAGEQPLPVIVSVGLEQENRLLAATYGLRCPVLVQDDTEVASLYGVTGTPASWLLDESGRIVDKAVGAAAVSRQIGITPAGPMGAGDWAGATSAYVDAGDWLIRLLQARRLRKLQTDVQPVPPETWEADVEIPPLPAEPPLVSVVLPTRDRPQLLHMALECYRRQTYPARELIVVDDGGRFPAAREAVRGVGGRLLRVEEGMPLGAKLNRGLAEARGPLCQKWDDDDWYAPRFLETLASAVLGHVARTGEPAVAYLTQQLWFDLLRWRLNRRMSWGPWGATLHFRREEWEERPFREIRMGEDGWFLVDQVKAGVAPLPLRHAELYLPLRHGGPADERDHVWKHAGGRTVEDALRAKGSGQVHPATMLPDWALTCYRELRRQGTTSASTAPRTDGRSVRGKPNLLYLAPTLPSLSGHGSRIHGAMVIQALSEHYRVFLVVVPMWEAEDREVPGDVAALCEAWAVIPPLHRDHVPLVPQLLPSADGVTQVQMCPAPRLWSRASDETLQHVFSQFRDIPFDIVHTFRLHMAPYAEPYLTKVDRKRPQWHMDLTEVESNNCRRIADLYRVNGREPEALHFADESRRYTAAEAHLLPQCDRIYVCSRVEQRAVCTRYTTREVRVLPNSFPQPAGLAPAPEEDPFQFLFVGTFSYYPNEDAAILLCSEILPQLRQRAMRPFRIVLVGSGEISQELRTAAQQPEVELVGFAPDLDPWYARAQAVVVPLRAGTGTRIKIIEAMSHRRPVVSTSIGFEGLEVRDGVHLLAADTPSAFAERCARLMEDRAERERLCRNAFEFYLRGHTPQVIGNVLAPTTNEKRTEARPASWTTAR